MVGKADLRRSGVRGGIGRGRQVKRGNASGLGAAGSDVRAEFAGDVGGVQQGLPRLSQGGPPVEPGVGVPAVLGYLEDKGRR